MSGKDSFALVPRPPDALEKAEPGAKRILSSMVADTLALVKKNSSLNTRQKILLVDDEPDIADMYREILVGGLPDQPEIHTATSGPSALAMLAAEPFDVLICDLMMPKMHGLEVLSIVRPKHPQLRTMILTVVKTEAFRSRAYALGVDLYRIKPTSEQEITTWLEQVASLLGQESRNDLPVETAALIESWYQTGENYSYGRGVPQDHAEAAKWYRKAAEQGFAAGQQSLGCCYDYGQGVAQDYAEAVKWYRKAAEQGDAAGQQGLGCCYHYGQGVAQDYAEAVKWFRKAAEQEGAAGKNGLGYCYYHGQGVAQDYAEAAKWFRKAAEQGDVAGQHSLGYCYQHGQGVSQDYAEAVKWFSTAAARGFAAGQHSLGWCYQHGQGVAQDYAEAAKWFRKAAERGYELAQQNLGALYANGRIAIEDPVDAYQWVKLAEEAGCEGAALTAEMIKNVFTSPEEFQEAERRYRKLDGGE